MQNLISFIESRVSLEEKDKEIIQKYFETSEVAAQKTLLEAGMVEQYVYFISSGIVKGYQNIDGKMVIQHLVDKDNIFTSLDSFISQKPTIDYYETITDCTLFKLSKKNFDVLQNKTKFWPLFIKKLTSEHLSCKLKRVQDFQMLTAKERYLKFLKEQPNLALHVSIENIASFLGMEPQSLSRIRKQITF
ncbi:Crp/Fnr family transcriptional regulator [Aureivirga sp. CE67]|uniref:Crp/Fnr family transcriptional regulator n=1 Tax=Aureivirga sp. CE67 TaxID=1788983 RepID=UPI0018CB216E|nr:Crp/Fnr family transcriptional regulator [Aureivirga sp. CE67]